jgi:hypothetical protein
VGIPRLLRDSQAEWKSLFSDFSTERLFQLNVHYTLLVGSPEVEKRFGIQGIPTTILLDRNGIIRKHVVGFEYTSVFESALQQLL